MKSKAHIRYKHNGVQVPGVTTIIGLRAKPALVKWANKLGLQGIDSSKYTDDKAMIGSLAHDMILCHFKGISCDCNDYSATQVSAAENSFLSFLEWEKGKDIEVLLAECPLTTEGYGGTIDLFCMLDGVPTLVDFKTGSGIYDEHYFQLSAYHHLLFANGHQPGPARILNIPRTEDESFKEAVYTDFTLGLEWFNAMLKIYQIEKLIKREEF